MKKVIALILVVVLTAAVAIGGTVAYLTSSAYNHNTMTVGNVKIAQLEYEREKDANGNYTMIQQDGQESYKLVDFTQDKMLLPATETDANGNAYNHGAGDYTGKRVRMSQVGSQGGMDVFTSPNAQDKFVVVENTGNTDAYVRTLIAFECGDKNYAEWDNLVGASMFMVEQGVWTDTYVDIVNIDGVNYVVFEHIYNGGAHLGGVHNVALPAGETTYPSLAQVYVKAVATNEDVANLAGTNNKIDILVLSQAVQADTWTVYRKL